MTVNAEIKLVLTLNQQEATALNNLLQSIKAETHVDRERNLCEVLIRTLSNFEELRMPDNNLSYHFA